MKKYHSEICEVMHKETVAQYELGLISEARMREFDELCLVQESEPAYEATPAITECSATAEHVTAAL